MGITVKDIAQALDAKVLAAEEFVGREVGCALAADLVSDILCCRDERPFLLTGLATIQVVRAAEVIDLVGICFCRGKEPPAEVIAYAREAGLPVLATKKTLYEAAGLVYLLGVKSGVYRAPVRQASCSGA